MNAFWQRNSWLQLAMFIFVNFVSLTAAFFIFISPVNNFFFQRANQIDEKRELFARLKTIVDREALVREAARKTEVMKDYAVLHGSSENVVSADLQTRLKSMIKTAGARLRSIRGVPLQTKNGITFIGAEVEISGPIRAIYQTIYAVESARQLLFINAADITISPQINAPLNKSGTDLETVLDARIEIISALQLDEKS